MPQPPKIGKKPRAWTGADDERLEVLWKKHAPLAEIAASLDRQASAVSCRARKIGLPQRRSKQWDPEEYELVNAGVAIVLELLEGCINRSRSAIENRIVRSVTRRDYAKIDPACISKHESKLRRKW